jgi:nucleobase:cation symporter-1, NCS1 family
MTRFGVQTYFGSQLFGVLLRCIFGDSWWLMANHLPESAGITSRDLLAFFLFWTIEMPFLTVHPSKIKFLFAVSTSCTMFGSDRLTQFLQAESIICPAACVGVFAWCIHYGGGIQVNTLTSTTPASVGGLGWAMLNGINSCLGVTSALLVNVSSSMSRGSNTIANIQSSNRTLQDILAAPRMLGGDRHHPSFLARRLYSSSVSVQRQRYKASLEKLTGINGIYLMRFSIVFGALQRERDVSSPLSASRSPSWVSILGVMPFLSVGHEKTSYYYIPANTEFKGADITGLLPRVFTIVPGQIFCGVVSLAIVPWKLLCKFLC